MPVHVYGNPCDVEQIKAIADKYKLKILYDAAHAFGVKKNGSSILNYGDVSVLSFHATKSFNTIEGGAILCHDPEIKKQIDYLKNFGFENETTVVGPGINAKMNELQAAFGLLQLEKFEENTRKRKELTNAYKNHFKGIDGLSYITEQENTLHNYSYFPIFIGDDYPLSRDELYKRLKSKDILGRRYFYPLISKFPPYNALDSASESNLMIAESKAKQVICLPLYSELSKEQVTFITNCIKQTG